MPAEAATSLGKSVLMVIAIVGGALLANDRKKAANAIRYETQAASRGDLVQTVSATGTLAPVNEVDIGSEISGTLLEVCVDYNDSVTNGQILARLDTSRIEAQLRQSQAELESVRARVAEAQATRKEAVAQLARLRQVHESSGGLVPSRNELDAQQATAERAEATVASAQADVSKAEAALSVVHSDIEKSIISAPINGIVLSRKIEPGQTVAASFEAPVLFTLAEDLAKLELRVDVDEADVGQVRQGQEAAFTVDAYPDRHFPARITQVRYESKTTEGVVTYTSVLLVDNESLLLRPGMTATAAITIRRVENALLIPSPALRFRPPQEEQKDNGGGKKSLVSSIMPRPPRRDRATNGNSPSGPPTVYLLENGELRAVRVETGLSDGLRTELVNSPIEEGAQVVTAIRTNAG